jgi:hypothetical protein
MAASAPPARCPPGRSWRATRPRAQPDRQPDLAGHANGQPFRLPGGEASLTVKTGFAYSGIHSTDTRTTSGAIELKRGDAQVGFSLDLPITSTREFRRFLGNLSLNLNGEAHLSDLWRAL